MIAVFRMMLAYLIIGLVVGLWRLVRGRKRPRWSWGEETLFELARFGMRRWTRRGIDRVQARLARLPLARGGPLRRVNRERVLAGGVPAVWVSPKETGAENLPIVLYLHGGGYVSCSPETHAYLLARLALAVPARVLAVDYRLAPAHPYPAALDDTLAAYGWLLEQDGGQAPPRIIFAGDSAGGGLVLSALMALRDRGRPLPVAAVLLSPWVDLNAEDDDSVRENAAYDYVGGREILQACRRAYLGEQDRGDPLLAGWRGDLQGLPPLLIQVGGAEVLLDQARRLAERAQAAGVEVTFEVWEDMVHVFQAFAAFVPDGRRAIDRIARFVADARKQTDPSRPAPAVV